MHMKQITFNKKSYKQRQKMMMRGLTHRPKINISLLGQVIVCVRDKPEWEMLCNANGWEC